MYKTFNRGFTLIELLVVIAIIGILASVVLVSLNSARNRGNDAAVKANLNGVRTQAELFYDTTVAQGGGGLTYTGLCTSNPISSAVAAAGTAGGGTGTCAANATGWAASAPLRQTNIVSGASGTDYWCVDSTGVASTTDTAIASGTTDTGCAGN